MHEKKKENTANGEWHDESTENVVVRLNRSVETVAPEMRRESAVKDSNCA